MDINEWYKMTTKGASGNRVSEKTGVYQSTLSRQIKTGQFSPEVIVAVAREYGASPVDALVVLGLITEEEVEREIRAFSLPDYSDEELVEEIYRRLQSIPKSGTVYDTPLTVHDGEDDAPIAADWEPRRGLDKYGDEDEQTQVDP